MKRFFPLLLLAVSLTAANAQTPSQIDSLARLVQTKWKIPAMGVAVVKDGSTLFSHGYGTLYPEAGAPAADENTQYVNASTSKAFTAAMIGILVDKGLIKWTDRVIDHLPDFQLYDPWITENFLIEDIMCHRIGFPAYTFDELPDAGFTRDQIYRMFRFVRPAHPFRTQYAYCNCTYTIAARIIEKYTGLTWNDAIAEYIFKPLEMTGSTTGFYGYPRQLEGAKTYNPRLALGNSLVKKGADSLEIRFRTNIANNYHWSAACAPAAHIMSTAADMAKWMQMWLGGGHYKNVQLLKPETVAFIWRPQILCTTSPEKVLFYAQSWRIEQGPQGKLIQHTGLCNGYTALVCLVPELNLGISMLCSQGNTTAPHYALVRQLIDMARGVNSDWVATEWKAYWTPSKSSQKKEKPAFEAALPLPAYTGNYYKQVFETVPVFIKDGKLWATMGKVTGPLTHETGNVFSQEVGEETFRYEFHIGPTGKADSFSLLFDYDLGPFLKLEAKE